MRPEEALSELTMRYRFKLINNIEKHREEALQKAKEELEFCSKHSIRVLPINSEDYPTLLQDCPDAPIVLYYRGNANLNARHILAVVGTRKITEYGKQICTRLTERLAELLPDTLVVSGLAYGSDIHAHRGCMEHGLATVGVVAHGMDQIYPATHRNDATRMLANGGILTEYTRGTRPMRGNFLRRNRIIAGMAHAVIVVESAEHGGSLVTARIAHSYQRDVFAFPGRINDPYSAGCNNLIANQMAYVTLRADDIIKELGWTNDTIAHAAQAQQYELFSDASFEAPHNSSLYANLPPEQQHIAEALQGSDGLNVSSIAAKTFLAPSIISNTLFDMEMDGIVKVLPGSLYILSK